LRWLKTIFVLGLSNQERDYTRGPINSAVILLAIPMMLEMFMESVFVIVDMFWVAKLGADAIAAVGLTEAVITVVYAVAIGLSMATTAMVARRIGEKKDKDAAVAAAQSLWIGLVVSVGIGAIGLLFAEDILRLMGASDNAILQGTGYTTVMLCGSISILYIFLLNAIFRGAGDANIAMRSLWLANGINLVLDPILIFGLGPIPAMGVMGAAVATTIGRSIGVVYQLWHLFGLGGRIRLAGRAASSEAVIRWHRSVFNRSIQLDIPDANRLTLWQPGDCRIHNCSTDNSLHLFTSVGLRQCGSDSGWTKPRREQTRTRRKIVVACSAVQLCHFATGCRGPDYIR